MTTTHHTFCSICSAFCGIEVDVEDNRITDIRGDASHPLSAGFTCAKGRQFQHLIEAPDRLTHCQKREAGELRTLAREEALDEIAARLDAIRKEHGPRSVALYLGNGCTFKTTVLPVAHAFAAGLETPMLYTSLTIDQPAKIIATGRHGIWAGGSHHFDEADVCLLLGNNPVVSGLSMAGAPPGWRPGAIKAARKRGLKLLVVDPRKTETAQLADMHLPIRPGQDATLLAGMIRLILENNWHDAAFCERFTDGLDALRQQVQPFTLEKVAALTELPAEDIATLTKTFACARKGTASSATGPDMAPNPNLTEHLILCLNTLCGRHNRAGDINHVPSLLTPDLPPMEMVVPADFMPDVFQPAKNAERSRLSGARQVFKEMPTATLANEILTPGEGQIKALIVIGGNPVMSWPDKDKTLAAMKALDLLVGIDVRHSQTLHYADYLLPASYGLERGEMTAFNDFIFDRAYHQYEDAVVPPPGDATEEWRYLAGLAQRLGTDITLTGGKLDSTTDEKGLFGLLYPEGSTKVPINDLMAAPHNKIWQQFEQREVLPGMEGLEDKLQFMPPDVPDEFRELHRYNDSRSEDMQGFSHLLCNRRNPHVYNSMGHHLPKTPQHNPAWLNPEDIAALSAKPGDRRQLQSAYGSTEVELAADPMLRPGVVSMSHCWGPGPVDAGTPSAGASVATLISTDHSTDPWVNMPVMSALPVRFV